jgi:D-sedoheptulose 7-phosphate isomerase
MTTIIEESIAQHSETISQLYTIMPQIKEAAETCKRALSDGHKILLFGNGGSAADAQHIATELTGRYLKERKGLPAIALTTDSSALTAIGNDYGYDQVFSRQTEALATKGDVLVGISTSGNSQNVINAFKKGIGCTSIALTGREGGKMKAIADINLIVPSEHTPRIQECHILIGHILCEMIEAEY